MLKRFRAALITPILLLSSYAHSAVSQTSQLGSDKRLTMYAKPAVVRVVTACFGEYSRWSNEQSGDRARSKGGISSDNGFAVGTGFFINPNGYIVTDSSLVKMSSEIGSKDDCKKNLAKKLSDSNTNYELKDEDVQFFRGVVLPNGEKFSYTFPPGSQSQGSKGVTVIKVEINRAPTLKLGNSENVQIQDQVLVLGYPVDADRYDISKLKDQNNADSIKVLQEVYNPKKLDLTVSKREISSPPRKLQTNASILQVDGQVGIGSAGSPVLNDKGEVVGIVTSNVYNVGYTYAVPTSVVNEFTVRTEEGETDRLYRSGLDLFWQGDYRRAFAQFQQVKALFPQHSEVDELITQSQTKMAEVTDKSPSMPWLPIAVGIGVGVAAVGGTAFFLGRRRTGLQPSPLIPPVPAPPEVTRRKRSQAMPENFRPNTAVKGQPFIKLTYQGQELVFDLRDDTYNLGRDAAWSDFKIPNEWKVISGHHAILQKEGEDFRIYDGDGQQPSTNGTYFRDSLIDASQGHLLSNGNQLKIGRNPNEQVLLTYFNPAKNQSNYNPTVLSQ